MKITQLGENSPPNPDELETAELLEASENVLAENLAAADCGKLEPAVPAQLMAGEDPSIPQALAIGYDFKSGAMISTRFVGSEALTRALGYIDAQRREWKGFEWASIANQAASDERSFKLAGLKPIEPDYGLAWGEHLQETDDQQRGGGS